MSDIEDKARRIANSFYKTEEERLSLIEQNRNFILLFTKLLYDDIMALYEKGIKFHIFAIKDNCIHAGLFPCCSYLGIKEINKDTREDIERKIKEKMNIQSIIWEDL